ncbi:MAG: T9SS type A sorting domain-containing protein, partial [bacterium]
PLDATRVLLTWRQVAGAEGYAIYRSAGTAPLQLLTTKTQNVLLDSLLMAEQWYRYAVATIDSQQQPIIGPRSFAASGRPSKPPVVVSAYFFAPHHVAVLFDEPMHESVRQAALFTLSQLDARTPINTQPQSVVLSRSGNEVILSFPPVVFTPGDYQMRVNGAVDVDRVPLDTTRNRAKFAVAQEPLRFYVVSAALESPQQILIRFNLSVDPASAIFIANYRLKTLGNSVQNEFVLASAVVVAGDSTAVRLTLAKGVLGPFGRNHLIEIIGVRSASGIPLRPGEGDAVGFAMPSANLNHVRIYPNPFLADRHAMLTIGGLTEQAVVKIIDVEGRVHATLEESDGNGGVDWDTRDARGNFAPSGVYLCYVTSGAQTTVAKFVIVR